MLPLSLKKEEEKKKKKKRKTERKEERKEERKKERKKKTFVESSRHFPGLMTLIPWAHDVISRGL